MTPEKDPWVLLNQLARDGLRNVRIRLTIAGREEVITDRALEVALAQLETDKPIEVPADLRLSVKAAIKIALMEAEEVAEVAQRAEAGDQNAQAIYQCVILRHLVSLRPGARALAAGIAKGDPEARRKAENIRRCAVTPGPKQFGARTSFFVLRDVADEMREQAKAAPPAPSYGNTPQDDASDADGELPSAGPPARSEGIPDLFPPDPPTAPGVH